jgi:hypothetical protein
MRAESEYLKQPANGTWVFLCLAFALLTGLTASFRFTIRFGDAQMRGSMPRDTQWLTGLIVANVVFLLLTPFAFQMRDGRAR